MQSTLEQALSTITQERVPVVGSGRTDAGAHAAHQVIAFSTDSRLPAESLGRAMNACLPRDIAITAVREVGPDFNPRKDALSRTYRYHIWNRPTRSPFMEGRTTHVKHRLDESAMNDAAQCLIGQHDLSSFIPARTEGERVRTIFNVGCERCDDVVSIQLEAKGFMRQMVRAIVGTLILVGKGKLAPDEFAAILSARDRQLAGDTAPAEGLYLVAVRYPGFHIVNDDVYLPAYPSACDEKTNAIEETS